MPQEIRVLQCAECKMFQVDIVKKATKWSCKICNLKQSFVTEYFRGSGPECRVLVQELNKNKGLSAWNRCEFTINPIEFRREQQLSSSESMKLNENEFAGKSESDNKKYCCGRDIDNHQNNNREPSFENTKCPTSSNKRILMGNDSCNSIKKICKWDKYV